ncbi:replicative DNA helicase DnaB [Limosilactobacillus frumenti DSM 13145]|uniref:Replicative DNA helicase n=1 Tax=Limosilactobacillus frumenti DSM 13145 TaxID=1423746 RepID=A0A0R1PCH4_9LACO|nr:replicative DNA helicase [Limosilactobacillus frumenti]KRL27842.1 replicative DNA helicase DnaB [Limosilactobacillus frumenti DSM 13145]MBA2914285.1 replicative DNA helicase [Limosilactobacillus frumenti]QFG71872.1 replicative DNA helicase [Limosilactobacillus frumenti]
MDNAPVQEEPRDLDAEKAVLGAAFLSKNALADAMEYLQPHDFYRKAHQIIFQKMIDLNDEDQPIDPLTMKSALDKDNQTENIGGVAYIAELASAVPTAANVVYYSKIVHDKAIRRRLINTATKIINKSYADDDSISDLLDSSEQQIMSVSQDNVQNGFQNIKDVLEQSLSHVNQLSQNDSEVTGLSTGYAQLDEMTTGLHKDELVIIAARPAVGKTAFALNIAQNVATSSDTTVAIFSLEMGAESLVNRMICAEGNINANHLRTGQLTQDEWNSLFVATGSLSKANIYIDDTAGIKVAEIRARCRRLAKEKGNLGLIVIDYLQLIEGTNPDNRQQEVSEISRQLKKLAKELEVPVIALSQLSRGVEQRQDKRPVLSDIRESGSIEQDADIVSFLYRDDYYEHDEDDDQEDNNQQQDDDGSNVSEVEVIIEKNRSGPRGTVKLLFAKSYNKFASVSYIPEDNN